MDAIPSYHSTMCPAEAQLLSQARDALLALCYQNKRYPSVFMDYWRKAQKPRVYYTTQEMQRLVRYAEQMRYGREYINEAERVMATEVAQQLGRPNPADIWVRPIGDIHV
jgi:hypothetical protein